MSPKEIAEKLIKDTHITVNDCNISELAHAYLELEKKLQDSIEHQEHFADLIKECKNIEVPNLKAEITKLKEENENLAHELETTTLEHESVYKMNKQYVENSKLKINQLREENEKLKKSREGLRKFVDHCCSWNEGEVVTGRFDSPWTAREAREAINADDEIMKGE